MLSVRTLIQPGGKPGLWSLDILPGLAERDNDGSHGLESRCVWSGNVAAAEEGSTPDAKHVRMPAATPGLDDLCARIEMHPTKIEERNA
jgi:hypothetical protein